MSGKAYLEFLNNIAKNKPNSFTNKDECPFCKRESLVDIIDDKGCFVLLKNKYPTLKDTIQLIIIESYDCNGCIAYYDSEYIYKLMRFSIKHWLNIEKNDEYKSVILCKNHGLRAGASLRHPHMQIVGFKNIDYKEELEDEYFEGIEIYRNEQCLLNLSTKPITELSEFNIIIDECLSGLRDLSNCLKKVVHFILNNFYYKCDSFNLFFYHWKSQIICKVVPRFVTSPLVVGYKIKQCPNSSSEIADKLKSMYFQ